MDYFHDDAYIWTNDNDREKKRESQYLPNKSYITDNPTRCVKKQQQQQQQKNKVCNRFYVMIHLVSKKKMCYRFTRYFLEKGKWYGTDQKFLIW